MAWTSNVSNKELDVQSSWLSGFIGIAGDCTAGVQPDFVDSNKKPTVFQITD